MHVDPATLNDNEWAMMWQDIVWIREEERKKGITSQLINLLGFKK